MADAPKDGGAAFPVPAGVVARPGMSLRDWFAGQALAGLGDWCPNNDDGSPVEPFTPKTIRSRQVEWAYAVADAMLAEREKW